MPEASSQYGEIVPDGYGGGLAPILQHNFWEIIEEEGEKIITAEDSVFAEREIVILRYQGRNLYHEGHSA